MGKEVVIQALRRCSLDTGGWVFVVLNALDAVLTRMALSLGAWELNPVMANVGGNVVVKVALAFTIALLLQRLGRDDFRLLNIAFLGIVLWNGFTVLIMASV